MRPNSIRLCEIIPCVLLTYRVDVHWGVARVCPSVQRALTAWLHNCTAWMPTKKGQYTHVCTAHSYLLRVLLIVTIMLSWRWIKMHDGSNWEWLRDNLSALTMRSDWFFLVSCHFLTDNSLQSADKDQQENGNACCGRETARCRRKIQHV